MGERRLGVVLAVVFLVAGGVAVYAAAKPRVEGTDVASLAARKLPAPAELRVLVLPFAVAPAYVKDLPPTKAERQTEVPRAAVLLNLQRHGFRIVPEASRLADVPAAADKALGLALEDKVPGSSDRDNAVAAARKVGADWVMYGEFTIGLDYGVVGAILPRVKKGVRVNLALRVADARSGEVVFWRQAEQAAQGSSLVHGTTANAEDAEIARRLLVELAGVAFDGLAKALPKHETGPEVTRQQLDALVGEMGY